MIAKIHHRYETLEEVEFGMWRTTTSEERVELVSRAVFLMSDHHAFKAAMRRVSMKWKRSCEHNLTSPGSNRVEWLGQAACCISVSSPEDATRQAWHLLSIGQQKRANLATRQVIAEWEEKNWKEEDYSECQRSLWGWMY